ncbi:hypothetical protein L6452_05752 [Arctium lappa]|uniref:Uncharacterized protein n=1 Tax=Arctium lappa TaxID=4217 RepID=A0ACB9EGU2_ARCLA|nr:hypothetical protein L6452_05752 [Arctium lappa]
MHRAGESLPVERQTRLESDVCKIRVSLGTRAYSLPDPDGGLCDASMGGRPVGRPTVQFTLGHRLGLDRAGESLPVERQTRLESDVCKIRVSLGTRAYSLPDPDGGLCDASMGGRPVGRPTVQFTLGHRLGLDRGIVTFENSSSLGRFPF